jgi:hypothetical protein
MNMTETEAEKYVARLDNGDPVLMAGPGKVLGAFAVDVVVLAAVAAAAYFVTAGRSFGGSLPVLAAIGGWIGGSLVYGMACFTGRTLGCLAAGSAFVRSADGGWPGLFRMAWVCLQQYVLVVIWIFGIIASGGSGTSGKAKKGRIYHRHIDLAGTSRLQADQPGHLRVP